MEDPRSNDCSPKSRHPPIVKSKLSKLSSKNEKHTKRFCTQMRLCGIAVVKVDDQKVEQCFEDCVEGAKQYFKETSSEKKLEQKMVGDKDWGYVEMEGVKEFWQMRNGADNPWKEGLAKRFFDSCSDVAEVCLATLARGLKTKEEELVENIVDSRDAPLSSTIFRFFHYYKNKNVGCQVHTDIGLITLIPASNLPSLEIMDNSSFDWYCFEEALDKNDVMVLCGETLELLTGFYYRSVVHRVKATQEDRYSLVYLMRGRPDALLDCRALKSPVIGELFEDFCKPVTVAKFMREQYLNKKSANFTDPGQGLPLANLKGETLKDEELKKWESNDDYDDEDEDEYDQEKD